MTRLRDARISLVLLVILVVAGVGGAVAWVVTSDVRTAHVLHPREAPVDVLEDGLRTLRIGDGRTARLDVPRGYERVGGHRWPLLVVLHTAADARGSGAAARLQPLRDGTRFLLFPEGEATAAPAGGRAVHAWAPGHAEEDAELVLEAIESVERQYRIDGARIEVLAEGDAAPVADALACAAPAGRLAIFGGGPLACREGAPAGAPVP